MNNKGFTLVELLGCIVIITILGLIATTSVLNYINTSKEKAEEQFLDDISTQIESYIELNSANFKKIGSVITFNKITYQNTENGSETNQVEVSKSTTAYQVQLLENGTYRNLTFNDLINGLNMTDEFQNPNTEDICSTDIEIEIYKDSDYVYYYFVDMENADGCPSSTNIDTRPTNLKAVLCSGGVSNAC